MTNFIVDKVGDIMENQENIRNISIIAHVDHGKTTLADCLIGHGDRKLDTDDQEKERGITIKSTAISLTYFREEEIRSERKKQETDEKDETIEGPESLNPIKSIPATNAKIKKAVRPYLVNLIDSPGHVEFSAEVTSALRLTDGALVVVDCIEGPKCQTETVLRQSIQERVKPVLFLNKLDRVLTSCNSLEHLYLKYVSFRQVIEKVNSIIKVHSNEEVLPQNGTVAFGSGLQGWAFTLKDFAKFYHFDNLIRKLMEPGAKVQIYSNRMNKWVKAKITKIKYENDQEWLITSYKDDKNETIVKQVQRFSKEIKPMANFIDKSTSTEELVNRLWGENYWDLDKQEWWPKNINDKSMQEKPKNCYHGFTYFVLYPLKILFDSIRDDKKNEYEAVIGHLDLKKKDIENAIKKGGAMKGKEGLLPFIMQKWMPAGKCLFDMIIDHLPSPIVSQPIRIKRLYTGDIESKEAELMKQCDKAAPVSGYISKTVYYKGSFISVCRVFSGTLKVNMSVSIMDQNYIPGESKLVNNVKIQRILIFKGGETIGINACPAGNVCGIVGVSDYISKSGTISSFQPVSINNKPTLHPFISMKFTVSNIVKVGIHCAPKDLNKLNIALRKLIVVDPLVQIETNESGQRLISGSGELHLEVTLKDLEDNLLEGKVKLQKSKPIISFCETILQNSEDNNNVPKKIITKTRDKHNRIKLEGKVLDGKFLKIIDDDEIKLPKLNDVNELKKFSRILEKEYEFLDGNKIWTFGCIDNRNSQNNILINNTKGVDYLTEIKESICQGFIQTSLNGALCGENMRGIRFDLLDAKIHSDPSHRRPEDIMKMVQRAMYGVELVSMPRLVQPIYWIEIELPTKFQKTVSSLIHMKQGQLQDIRQLEGDHILLCAHLPIINSFGFSGLIGGATSGEGFLNMNFSHWEPINVDPYQDEQNIAYKLIMEARERKGFSKQLPKWNDYFDKIDKW